MKIKLVLENLTPLLVGGKKPANTNYIQSLDYIPGQVLRAALAREITSDCPYREWEDCLNDTPFWVSYLKKGNCTACRWQVLCKNFDRMIIAPAYPKGGIPVTAGARRCKYNRDHTLVEPWRIKEYYGNCPDCQQRLDSVSGYYVVKNGKKVAVGTAFRNLTRLAISPKTLKARDGHLYTLTVIQESGGQGEQYFVTTLEIPEEDNIDLSLLPNKIWVGSQTGRGLGYCQLNWELLPEEETVLTDSKVRLLFYSDVKIPVDQLPDEKAIDVGEVDLYQLSYEILQNLIQQAAGSDSIKLESWSLQSEWRRSYTLIGAGDSKGGRWQGPFPVLQKGSYIEVSGEPSALHQLLQHGLGLDRINGYGLLKVLEA